MDHTSYQQICSFRTVQSDKHGFFNEFYQEVKCACGDKWLQNYFGQLKSNAARILSIFSDREVCDTVLGVLENVSPVYKPKDSIFSAQRRAQADKQYLLGDLKQALALANLAVMRAPAQGVDEDIDDGLSLAYALRTRATILIALGQGSAALSDLKLAANFGLDTKQNPEYYAKLALAYASNGDATRADISLKVAEKLAGIGSKLIESCRQEMANVNKAQLMNSKPKPPEITYGESKELRGASSAVKLVEAKDKGRFIVANSDLKTGDIVLCEEPVAACLLPTYFGSHCMHCFERLVTPVPCLNCSGIAFCSAQCMGEACNSYHRFECKLMDLFVGSGMSILCYIALRIFTQAKSLEAGLDTAILLMENLCTHDDARQADDYLQRSLMAAFLLRCLQKGNYFGRRTTEGVNPTALELQVATALLGLLQVLQYNAHEIYETLIMDEHRFDGSKVIYVGAGLYGTGAYFNHECWPTVSRYFVGKKLVLAANRPHRPNEIVAENYGPIFTTVNLKERQRSLRGRYLFDCNCLACQENWPTLQKLDQKVRFWCPSPNCVNLLKYPKDISKEVRCPRCRKNVSLKDSVVKLAKAEALYHEAAQEMQNQVTLQAIELFKEGIDLFFQVATLPHRDTVIAQQSLVKCLADTGTTFKK